MPAVSKTILVVDDESGIREVLKERFEAIGLRCLTAADGAEALEVARTEHPSLIVLDLVMPVMDGLSVYRALKESDTTRDIRIVVYSAQDPETIMEGGVDALEIVDFVLKPLDLKSLTFLVNKTLNAV